MEVYNQLAALRKAKGLSQEEVAEKLAAIRSVDESSIEWIPE